MLLKSFLAPLARFWIPFWRPLDFEGSHNRPFSHKIKINHQKGCPGRRLDKKMICGWILDAKMIGSEKQKQAFRIILVAKDEFSGSHEIERKLMPKGFQKRIKIGDENAPRSIFREFGKCCRKSKFTGFL